MFEASGAIRAGGWPSSLRERGVRAWSEAAPYALLALAYGVANRWVGRMVVLNEQEYRSGFVTGELVVNLVWSVSGLLGIGVVAAVAVFRRDDLLGPWPAGDRGAGVRAFVLGLVTWATWAAVTFDHNMFYDRSFDLDRFLVVAFAALVVWRPVFVIPHLFVFRLLEHQFDHPLGRQIFSRVILEHLLILFATWLLVAAVMRRREARHFVLVAGALLAAFYWYPGLVKLARGWLVDGTPYLGGFASYANGWLSFWPVERVDRLIETARLLDLGSRVLTLAIELGAVVFFVHRLAARVLLGGWVVLHLGIWVFSGISFLVWMAVDLAFLGFLLLARERPDVFTPVAAVTGGLLILLSPWWVGLPGVGWFDTPVVYTYRYVAVDSEGNTGAFPADATPRGQAWCGRDFPEALDEPALAVQFGKTNDRSLANRIAAVDGEPDALFALEAELGVVRFDEAGAATVDRFLADSARTWNRRRAWEHALSPLAPPATCLWPKAPPEPLLDSEHPIEAIHLEWLTFLYDGEHYDEIRRVRIRTIDVDP